MQIAQARAKAEQLINKKMIESRAKRPNPEERVMIRDPKGQLLLAPDRDTLVEKLAKKLQRLDRSLH